MDPFGRRIAKQRAELGWTQARLAERIAVSRVALSHLEAGMTVANERTVVLLAATFGLEPHELVAGTDYPSAKADRLPLVVARHTEVDLQLARLASDVAWIERLRTAGAPAPRRVVLDVLDGWRARLSALEAATVEASERRRVVDALRGVRALLVG